jgi:hypothetical protein
LKLGDHPPPQIPPPWRDMTPPQLGENDPTTDDDVEKGTPVQPVQAKGVGDVRKVEGNGGDKVGSVEDTGGEMGGSGVTQGGGCPNVSESERVSLAKPLVEVERKLTAKVKEPVIQEVITPAQRELVAELERMQGHDPDIVPQQGGWGVVGDSREQGRSTKWYHFCRWHARAQPPSGFTHTLL